MQAMGPDGMPVPITFDPESGRYVTANGEPVIIQMEGASEENRNQEMENMEQDATTAGEKLTNPKST